MTGNPTLNQNTFTEVGRTSGDVMTVQGTVNKTAILLALTVGSASYTWQMYLKGDVASASMWITIGVFGGLIMALVTSFKREWSAITAPLYAILEGLFLGGISSMLEQRYHGIAMQAVILTFGTLAALLAAYTMGIIRASSGFVRGITAATGGICLLYFVSWILSFFHIQIPMIYGSGSVGIVFSLFVVVIAALNLIIDFAVIENGARQGAPKYFEWYAAFGLMVTLVWLYLEILRLLAKLSSRRD